MGLTLSCRQHPWICVAFCLVWLRRLFVLFRCFLCWRNAKLAGRFACRRFCRVSFCCVCFSMVYLVCEAKGFHTFCTLFYRFSHCQDRALERDRPQQEKKNYAIYKMNRGFEIFEVFSFNRSLRFFCPTGTWDIILLEGVPKQVAKGPAIIPPKALRILVRICWDPAILLDLQKHCGLLKPC